MLKSRQAKAMALAGLMGVAGLMAGCPGPTDPTPPPKTCDCPNGTIHLTGESCCEGIDCACETGVVGKRLECGIPVTNRGGVVDMDYAFNNVKEAYEAEFLGYEQNIAILSNNVKEIRIVPISGESSNIIEDGKYVIILKEDLDKNSIQGIISELVYETLSAQLKQFIKDNVLGDALVPGTKFDIA